MSFLLLAIKISLLFNSALVHTKILIRPYPSEDIGFRIVGGQNANRYQFPFIVSIHIGNKHGCGGSILTNSWILTAAHCSPYPNAYIDMVVYAGLLHQGERHQDIQASRVQQFIFHPYYQQKAHPAMNDVALIKLSSRLQYTKAVSSIRIGNANFTKRAYAIGWGEMAPGFSPITLQYFYGSLMDTNVCQNALNNVPLLAYLKTENLCIQSPNHNACSGDSGGPLMQNGLLIGIASWGDKYQCRKGVPTVYTKTANYMNFISYHIR